MQKPELDYLTLVKKESGKDYDTINSEIDFLLGSQIEFKNIKKEINKLIKIIEKKDKEIIKLRTELDKLKENNFKLKLNKDSIKISREETRDNLNGYINRILNHLDKDKEYTKSDISSELLIPQNRMNECLDLLKKMKQIDFRICNRGVVRYKLVNGN